MPIGGKRPGAGAPLGNRNRLRHGRKSRYVQETLIPGLAPYPSLQQWFIWNQRRASRKNNSNPAFSSGVIQTVLALSELPPDNPMRHFHFQRLNDSLERRPVA